MALALTLVSSSSKAEEQPPLDKKWLIEANLGTVNSHWQSSDLLSVMQSNAQDISITNIDDTRSTQELLAGYRFHRHFAFELGYRDWGEISYTSSASSPNLVLNATQNHYPASGWGAFTGIRASHWQGDNLEGYIKLSAWDWSRNYSTFINDQEHTFKNSSTDAVINPGMMVIFISVIPWA